ncbi:hypothetical protein DRN73_06635 [Candidatus Pacearchaeota archaeon]|nr:MAG: hypothetical protein DRN73_06635 [Candidatus Pacearchaeota archaeon]
MGNTKIPTLYVEGENIPETFYKTFKEVHEKGLRLRTQYDRKNPDGTYLDPPSKDARVMIRINDLFGEPSLPIISYVQVGKYIAEMLGAKDYLVLPRDELLRRIHKSEEDFEATEWPYAYHQRLTAYPLADGTLNQLEKVVEKLAHDPITRRAIAITGVPEIDLFMKSDAPCLRELQFRGIEDEQGRIVLNTFARWRSRDLYKAWCDNIIGLRNLIRMRVAEPLEEKTGKKVIIGPYSEENGSLHIYGQDYSEKGADSFLRNNPSLEEYIERTRNLQDALQNNIIEELKDLKKEGEGKEKIWNFPLESIALIDRLIKDFESGRVKP